jgi:hypothetical protein
MTKAAQSEAIARINEVLANTVDALGPKEDAGLWVPSEFVVVTCWVRMEDGLSQLTRFGSPGMLSHHMSGLLWEALDEVWEQEEE